MSDLTQYPNTLTSQKHFNGSHHRFVLSKPSLLTRSLISFFACALAVLILAPAASAQGSDAASPTKCAVNSTPIAVTVSKDLNGEYKIQAQNAVIDDHGKVCWTVAGLSEGQTLVMRAKDECSKKIATSPASAIYPNVNINSHNSKPGGFNYELVLMVNKEQIAILDPYVFFTCFAGCR